MKATQALLRRVRQFQLTTKQAGKGYYKGNRSGAMGVHDKWGGYVVDWERVRTYVVPENLSNFKLTPFVTRKILPMRGRYGPDKSDQPISGQRYLERWKAENGED